MTEGLLGGLELLFQPAQLVWLVGGLCLGFMVGVLPGLSTSNTAALLLPFSVTLDVHVALILIVSVYAGAAFGGAIPAILVNVPGEPGSAVTALDGYQLARQGQAGLAIGVARLASALGGIISAVVVLSIIGPLGQLAMKFGAREMFAIVLLGLFAASSLIGANARKGVLAALLGLLLATVGASPLSGQGRFTFGMVELYDGISFVPALIGVFAISEMLILSAGIGAKNKPPHFLSTESSFRAELRDAVRGAGLTLRRPGQVVQSSAVGMFLGVVPGIGTGVANFFSYAIAKRRSKHPETFGKGAPEGVIASEACDNAVTTATLVPTFVLGIPGSATMAVILAQLYIQGIQPGPGVMSRHAPEVYSAVLAMLVASILIVPIGILVAAPLIRVTRIPLPYLIPLVLVLALAGSYAVRNSLSDVLMAVCFGVLGLFMRLHGYPVIPLILGLVLGPLAEEHLMRSLALGRGDFTYLVGSPLAKILWAALVLLVLWSAVGPALKTLRGRRKEVARR